MFFLIERYFKDLYILYLHTIYYTGNLYFVTEAVCHTECSNSPDTI